MKEDTSRFTTYLQLGVFTLFAVALDQWTKLLATVHLKGSDDIILIPGVFQLQYLENRGMAFGMMQGGYWILSAITVVIMAAILYVLAKIPRSARYLPLKACAFLIFAGSVGNLIDRVTNQFVVDFFYFSLIDFPVFNVADIYVTCAAFAFLFLMFFYYREEELNFLK